MNITKLRTPALILDRHILQKNADHMRKKITDSNLVLRPHVKTSKCIEVAQIALDSETGPITVSTLQEAEYFFQHGFKDMIYAVSIVPGKFAAISELIEQGADLKVVMSNTAVASALLEFAKQSGTVIPVMIEIDCDGCRDGINSNDEVLIELGELLTHADNIRFEGVMTHAGAVYGAASEEEQIAWAEKERKAVLTATEKLQQNVCIANIISVGSSPTALRAERFDGVTEVRAGVYLFNDLYQAGLGVCSLDDIALSVLTTVIGHNKNKGCLITDAGMLALSHDRSTAKQRNDYGYGLISDINGKVINRQLVVTEVNQEHGMIPLPDTAKDFEQYPPGTLLRILPNHACATAAAYDEYYVIDNSIEVSQVWERVNGW